MFNRDDELYCALWWPVFFCCYCCFFLAQGLRPGVPAESLPMVFATPTKVVSEAGATVEYMGANRVPDFQRLFQVMNYPDGNRCLFKSRQEFILHIFLQWIGFCWLKEILSIRAHDLKNCLMVQTFISPSSYNLLVLGDWYLSCLFVLPSVKEKLSVRLRAQ